MKNNNKYFSGNGNGIGTCPYCRGVIFRDLKRAPHSHTSFQMRCPHCQKNIRIEFDNESGVVIKKLDPK